MEGHIPSDSHSPGPGAQTPRDLPSGPADSGKRMGTRPEIVGVSLPSRRLRDPSVLGRSPTEALPDPVPIPRVLVHLFLSSVSSLIHTARAEGRRRRSGSGPRGCGGPQSSDGPLSLSLSGGRCRRGLAAGRSPGAGGSAAAPPAPAAGCDRPGLLAAAFCRAGPARSAAAEPGRAGPPRPAGVLAAVIPLPPLPRPHSPRDPPRTLPLAASPVPLPLILALSKEPAGGGGGGRRERHRCEGLGLPGGPLPCPGRISQVGRRNPTSPAGGDRVAR